MSIGGPHEVLPSHGTARSRGEAEPSSSAWTSRAIDGSSDIASRSVWPRRRARNTSNGRVPVVPITIPVLDRSRR